MIEVKKIQLATHHFLGIYINLPQNPIHFILSVHTILAQDNFSIEYFEKRKTQTAVILCRYRFGFEGLLESEVIAVNAIAAQLGVKKGMIAKEALLLCEDRQEAQRQED